MTGWRHEPPRRRSPARIGENPKAKLAEATLPSKPLTFSGPAAEISCPQSKPSGLRTKKGRAADAARPVEFREESPPGVGKGGRSPLVTGKE
ncbi:hypothetical protein [Azospirillum largimobile]